MIFIYVGIRSSSVPALLILRLESEYALNLNRLLIRNL